MPRDQRLLKHLQRSSLCDHMKNDTGPYCLAAKYYDELISDDRDQVMRYLYWTLLERWGDSNRLPRCLDVGCGTGGIFQHWSTSNIDPQSCGIDPVAEMIALARINCPMFQFESFDLLSFEPLNKYDWIVSTGNPINYISPDDRKKFFKKVRKLLAPGGLFYFDFDTRRDIEEFWPGQTRVVEAGSFRFEAEYAYDAERDLGVEKQFWSQLADGGSSFSETHYLHPISPDELVIEMSGAHFQEPLLIDPETYLKVVDPTKYLFLGCLAKIEDG